jgi:DNA polymerase III delta subunit
MNKRQDYNPQYRVFKEYFVLCWSGDKKQVKNETFFSRVDIELINERVRLFYSALDEVSISYSEDTFKIIEYVRLGLQQSYKYYKLEKKTINFDNNANYSIESNLIFEPPQFDKKVLYHIYNTNNMILEKLEKNRSLVAHEIKDLHNLAASYLICYLNGFDDALPKLEYAKPYIKKYDSALYNSYKETIRILRKVKYS